MWVNKKDYEKEQTIKKILFSALPITRLMWKDIDNMVEHNYPAKSIIRIIRNKYIKNRKENKNGL